MSRVKIGAVVAVLVTALTAAAYLLATRRLEAAIESDVEARVIRAEDLLTQISTLESFELIARAQSFARDSALAEAAVATDRGVREAVGQAALRRFVVQLGGSAHPDFLALVDAKGAVAVADSPLPDSDDLKSRFTAVAAALDLGQPSKDIWAYGKSTVKVGVAPVVDATGTRVGAVIVGYAISSKEAQEHARTLGSELAYFAGDSIIATSFARSAPAELEQPALKQLIADTVASAKSGESGERRRAVTVRIAGGSYAATAGLSPLNYADRTSGVVVLESLDRAFEPVGTVRYTILLLGLAALVVALLTMMVTARLILHQAEDLEAGVTEIINGDTDYSFKPVGADLDSLANGLNVMLARVLGRPEPGDDALDDDGVRGKVQLDDGDLGGVPVSSDAATVALANEPEQAYFQRLFDEYVAARRAVGDAVDSATLDAFVAKLRLSETGLKKKYNCRAVRFRVLTKDRQVTLKPVPIL